MLGAHPRPVFVPPQGSIEEPWILSASHHWYDLSVSSNDDPTFLRRLAGHVENGRPSISDPAADTRITARPKSRPKGFPSLIPA